MSSPRKRCGVVAATLAALGVSLPSQAVHLGADGFGQALIYPYYTVRTAAGNAFNTYLTVVNSMPEAKAVRVRLREGRAARPVLDFNLYLSPNDVWAGAVVPTTNGAQVLTNDTSCTDPAFVPTGITPQFGLPLAALPLHANAFTGTNADGFGDTLDRTREGYVEVIEMATLSGASAAAVAHTSAGVPANCAAIRATTTMVTGAPSGGLSGTLTLINVASGLDFTLDATALDALSTRAFFRPPGDPYPDFNALEIEPVSVVVNRGVVYRSLWARPVDAVSAVLMRPGVIGEYMLDNATASLNDVVLTFPTRHHYVSATQFAPPFSAPGQWAGDCARQTARTLGERLGMVYFNREEQGAVATGFCMIMCTGDPYVCAASAVGSLRNNATHMPPANPDRTAVLGSTTGGIVGGGNPGTGLIAAPSNFQNGWFAIGAAMAGQLVSLPLSTRTDVATGQVTAGEHRHGGLPVVGFWARTFTNGTLACGAGACQGNYGGAFPMRYFPAITP